MTHRPILWYAIELARLVPVAAFVLFAAKVGGWW
jgi:hypothetical protein